MDGTAEPASTAGLSPAEAGAELLRRGAELAAAGDDDEIERLAAIADRGDEERDSFRSLWAGKENDSGEVSAVLDPLRNLVPVSAPRPCIPVQEAPSLSL